MRSFLIVASLASLAGVVLTEAATAATVEMSQSELKAYCDKKGGNYDGDKDSGSTYCMIGSGKSLVVISCGGNGKCTMSHTMVFSSSSSKHGPADQAPASTLPKGSKNSSGAGSADASTLAGNTSPNHAPATNSNGAPATIKIPGVSTGGGGLPLNGRPRLQQQ
jgi:hypothetical protein